MEQERTASLEQRFRHFITELFVTEGFQVLDAPAKGGADLTVVSSQATAVVELKLFRSSTVPTATVLSAIGQTEALRQRSRADVGILAFLSSVENRLARPHRKVVVYDYATLAFLASKNPELAQSLEHLAREAFAPSEEATPAPTSLEKDVADLLANPPPPPPPIIQPRGRNLCEAIRAVPPGREHAAAFEKQAGEAIRYIFENDLVAWSAQRSSERLSRYDLIARISSMHDFWKDLSQNFRCRFVIFEFKNYSNPITQKEIYTTEKYLYPTALRSIAFTVSPYGADANGEHASRGALREQGKLIVNLSVSQICAMLERRDKFEDHNGLLLDVIDTILMSLER